MQGAPDLVLRDIHPAMAPPWWPPAPGWWLVGALLLLAALAVGLYLWRRRARRRAIARVFDDTVSQADGPAARVAAISELLRRASRKRDPDADRLRGDAWLRFLDDGTERPAFDGALGELLLHGAYRPDRLGQGNGADVVAEGHFATSDVERLRTAARTRFLQWMGAGK